MKRTLVVLCLLAMLFSAIPASAGGEGSAALQWALEQAEALGLPVDRVRQASVTGEEMASLLDAFLRYAAPEQLDDWREKFPNMRASREPLSRFDGMAYWFLAAQKAGGDYLGHRQKVLQLARSLDFDWDIDLHWALFDDPDLPDAFDCGEIEPSGLDAACYYYNLGRVSLADGEHPFPIDRTINAIPFGEAFTYADALLAVVRLVCSTEYDYPVTETDAAFLTLSERRRAEIEQASATPNVSGTVYYISNEGDDSGDGRSLETAWATPLRAARAELRPGDALLFRRGDTWYLPTEDADGNPIMALELGEGVLAGAYGEGAKPVLRGDIPEANRSDFWELYYSSDGVKIWRAAETVRDVPVIVFNGGARYAAVIRPWLDAEENYILPGGEPFIVEEALYKDLTFCSLPDMDDPARGASPSGHTYVLMRGPLYLRCDAGNPAEVFEDVAVGQLSSAFSLHPDAALYDLDLRHFTMTATGVTSNYDRTWGQTFSNLEIGWCGGFLMDYERHEPAGIFMGCRPVLGGGGLTAMADHCAVRDCFIHDCGPFSVIVSVHAYGPEPARVALEDIDIVGNLIENGATALHMGGYAANDLPGSESFVSGLAFEDNVVVNTGACWISESKGIGGETYPVLENRQGAINTDGIRIRKNVFYNRGVYPLFSLTDYIIDSDIPAAQVLQFEHNTYAQMEDVPFLLKNDELERYYPSTQTVATLLGDEAGELVLLDQYAAQKE